MKTSETKPMVREAAQESRVVIKSRLAEILKSYKADKGELIPILQDVQHELGYLPEEALKEVAKYIRVPESTIFGVATFYAQLKLAPTGRNTVRVCRGTACHVRGAPRILDEVQKRLKIKPGETTEDFEYSLETIACFGSCALAPVMVVNEAVYGRMTPSRVVEVLGDKGAAE